MQASRQLVEDEAPRPVLDWQWNRCIYLSEDSCRIRGILRQALALRCMIILSMQPAIGRAYGAMTYLMYIWRTVEGFE
jgi:hypothetical protein